MTNKECYRIWAPFNKKWTNWVRPVPFIPIKENMCKINHTSFSLPYLLTLDKNDKSIAIIVDLPGIQSVEVGILLAKEVGYRPIPIYNGTIEQKGSRATTDNICISNALVWGAMELSKIELKEDAPPVFLTDTNRLERHQMDFSIFDNSWDVYHQDLPSEDYFIQNGISKILVVSSNSLSKDLGKIFNEYPNKKIQILLTDGYSEPKIIRKGKK